ncbi:MAG: hypothetical protein HY053_09570, partial [Proteobacteria bacterium]|nr:hypothetical protein [Pseudomonadota bacterium]
MSENKKKFHLLTEMGGHSTPVADIIWAKPYERGEEYSRHKLGIKAESDVTARGPYSGGASQVNFEEFVRGGGLVKLPNDDLALNPNIKFRIGVWQPSQYRLYENSRGYTSYVEYEGTGVMWGGQRPIRENLKTPIETLLKILPNAAIDASEPPKDDPEREAYKIVWASTVAPWRKGLERIADQYYNGYTPRTEKEL